MLILGNMFRTALTRSGILSGFVNAIRALPGGVRSTSQSAGSGYRYSSSVLPNNAIGEILRRTATALGFGAAFDFFIPDGIFPELFGDRGIIGGGGGQHPGTVVKSWTANGTPFVRLQDGRQGAMKRDGVWKYWRPKKPIVLYSGGSSNLNTLLKADKAAERQLKKVKKVVDRRFPKRTTTRRSTPPMSCDHGTVVQTGKGVLTT